MHAHERRLTGRSMIDDEFEVCCELLLTVACLQNAACRVCREDLPASPISRGRKKFKKFGS
jgi:hypothetical protein